MAGVLERFAITETEFKDLLVNLEKAGRIIFEGMTLRQRKPKDGTTIGRGTAPWPDPQGG